MRIRDRSINADQGWRPPLRPSPPCALLAVRIVVGRAALGTAARLLDAKQRGEAQLEAAGKIDAARVGFWWHDGAAT
jgi:hypothetical protein